MTENASHGNIPNTRVNMDAGRASTGPREQPAKGRVCLDTVDEIVRLPNGKMPSAVSRKAGRYL
jgi:hypothetical protein